MAVFSATTSSNKYITIELETRVDGQSVANNTTTISWWLRIKKSSSSTSATWGNCSYSANVGGQQKSGSGQVNVAAGGTTELLSGQVTVPHSADGTLTISVSASISGKIVGSVSGTQAMTTIPRASSMTVSGNTLGSPVKMVISAASSGFKHLVNYNWGGETGFAVWDGSAGTYTWTPPLSFASKIPNGTSGLCTLTLETYSGQSMIGSKQYQLTLYVPSSVTPSVSDINVSEAVSGLAEQFGAYVQRKSRLRIQTDASGAYGSTISSCSVKVDGGTYSGTDVTSNIINSSGTVSITATVTDSRGRSASKTVSVSVAAYTAPAITALSAHRCNADGSYNTNGDYVYIDYAYHIAAVGNKNTPSATLSIKRSTGSDWTQVVSNSAYSANTHVVPSQQFLSDYQFDVRLVVADYFDSTSMTARVPTAETILDISADGTAVACGKTAEEANTFDCEKSIIARNGIRMASGKSVIDEAVDAVQVGGANLILNSRTLNGVSVSGTILANQYRGCSAVLTGGAWQGIYFDLAGAASRGAIKAGDVVTVSVMVMTDFDAATPCYFTLYRAPEKLDFINLGYYTLQPHTWQKISVSFTVPDGDLSDTARIETDSSFSDTDYSFGGKHMYFAAPKLEHGNKATDWTPAPEDTADYIIASGTSGVWTYRKWASGQAECWCSTMISYANDSVLEGHVAFPFTFTATPTTLATLNSNGDNYGNAISWNLKCVPSTTHARIDIHSPSAGFTSSTKLQVAIYAKGAV